MRWRGLVSQQNLIQAGVPASLQTCWPLLGCVFLMGVHSAIFGPSKYGLLPELLPERKLSWGNGVLELGTFISIIGGTVAGGVAVQRILPEAQAGPAWS